MIPHRQETGWQGPTNGGVAKSYGELFQIVTHPAFRIGFLDAQAGKPLDHDKIGERIERETPARAFDRMGVLPGDFCTAAGVELAQYRYEEGRLAVIREGLRCKAWGHPDFIPAKVREYIWNRADKTPHTNPLTDPSPSIVAKFRGEGMPLFAGLRS